MAENPLVHVPVAWPALFKANELRRQAVGRVRSVDMLQWDGVAYGEHPRQSMHYWELNDLCPRDGWPAVLLLHGGGWVEGHWRDFTSTGPQFARKGLLAAGANYRLAPEARWPDQLDDVLAALDYVLGSQTDPERIALWGFSAGGHLALMAALARPDLVRCVVAVGAPSDLRQLSQEGADDLGLIFDDADLEAASPLFQDHSEAPPMLLVHGTADRVVSIEHARRHAAAFDNVELIEVEDGDHGLRWPPLRALRARRRALRWMMRELEPPSRGSKWKRKKKKSKK